MIAPSIFEDLLRANDSYAETFTLGTLEAVAARGLAIVTCFDSRIEPLAMLGLAPGDAKILRVAGGRVDDSVIESLHLATTRLGVDRIAIVQHTECAAPSVGPNALAIDVARVRAELDVPRHRVAGFVYDVRTGRLTIPDVE
jgi:carbonic anhydrase